MHSQLEYITSKDVATKKAASGSSTAKKAASRLEVLEKINKLNIQHYYDYICCGVCLRSHQYAIHDDKRELLFTGIQQLHKFGASEYMTGFRTPLLIYHFSNEPILQLHFGAPRLFEFTPSSVAVTLPSEVLIGSLKKLDTGSKSLLGSTITKLEAFDYEGSLLFTATPSHHLHRTYRPGTTHYIKTVKGSSRIAKIHACSGNCTVQYKGEIEISPDIRSLILASAIWLEIIERKKPRWRS